MSGADEDRDPNEGDRRGGDRRFVYGELLMAAFAASRRPLGFDDLVHLLEGRGAMLSDVADWLATARSSGLLDDQGFETSEDGTPIGPRRFVLAASARAVIRVDRRRGDRRSAA